MHQIINLQFAEAVSQYKSIFTHSFPLHRRIYNRASRRGDQHLCGKPQTSDNLCEWVAPTLDRIIPMVPMTMALCSVKRLYYRSHFCVPLSPSDSIEYPVVLSFRLINQLASHKRLIPQSRSPKFRYQRQFLPKTEPKSPSLCTARIASNLSELDQGISLSVQSYLAAQQPYDYTVLVDSSNYQYWRHDCTGGTDKSISVIRMWQIHLHKQQCKSCSAIKLLIWPRHRNQFTGNLLQFFPNGFLLILSLIVSVRTCLLLLQSHAASPLPDFPKWTATFCQPHPKGVFSRPSRWTKTRVLFQFASKLQLISLAFLEGWSPEYTRPCTWLFPLNLILLQKLPVLSLTQMSDNTGKTHSDTSIQR